MARPAEEKRQPPSEMNPSDMAALVAAKRALRKQIKLRIAKLTDEEKQRQSDIVVKKVNMNVYCTFLTLVELGIQWLMTPCRASGDSLDWCKFSVQATACQLHCTIHEAIVRLTGASLVTAN